MARVRTTLMIHQDRYEKGLALIPRLSHGSYTDVLDDAIGLQYLRDRQGDLGRVLSYRTEDVYPFEIKPPTTKEKYRLQAILSDVNHERLKQLAKRANSPMGDVVSDGIEISCMVADFYAETIAVGFASDSLFEERLFVNFALELDRLP